MKAFICAGGDSNSEIVINAASEASLLVAADGGARHFLRCGLIPDVAIGDFDSLKPEDMEKLRNSSCEIIPYPERKNITDLELAVMHVCAKNITEIIITGATGSRLDQTLASIMMLAKYARKSIAFISVYPGGTTYIGHNNVKIAGKNGAIVSIIPLCGDVLVDDGNGLEYGVTSLSIPFGSTMPIGNRINADEAEITISKGIAAIVIHTDDRDRRK